MRNKDIIKCAISPAYFGNRAFATATHVNAIPLLSQGIHGARKASRAKSKSNWLSVVKWKYEYNPLISLHSHSSFPAIKGISRNVEKRNTVRFIYHKYCFSRVCHSTMSQVSGKGSWKKSFQQLIAFALLPSSSSTWWSRVLFCESSHITVQCNLCLGHLNLYPKLYTNNSTEGDYQRKMKVEME